MREPLPSLVLEASPAAMEPSGAETAKDSAKELSMIVEDDEPAERSRVSPVIPSSEPLKSPKPDLTQSDRAHQGQPRDQSYQHSAALSRDVDMVEVASDADEQEDEESPHMDVTSTSVNTLHTIPLSPHEPDPESDPEPTSARTADFHTAPLPKVSLPPVPVEDEQYPHTEPLPRTSATRHEEYVVPLRDEPPQSVPGLSRKPSIAHFTGLPAPSPLRKSLRAPGDTAVTAAPSTSGPAALGKRSSTTWLSKARETKALESTAKRTSTFGATKRKSSDMLDAAHAVLKSLDEEERLAKIPKLSSTSPDAGVVEQKQKLQVQGAVCLCIHRDDTLLTIALPVSRGYYIAFGSGHPRCCIAQRTRA